MRIKDCKLLLRVTKEREVKHFFKARNNEKGHLCVHVGLICVCTCPPSDAGLCVSSLRPNAAHVFAACVCPNHRPPLLG